VSLRVGVVSGAGGEVSLQMSQDTLNSISHHLMSSCTPDAIVGKDQFGLLMNVQDHERLIYALSDKRQRRKLRRIKKMKEMK